MSRASVNGNCIARALYNNEAETPDELAFCEGDLVTVLEQNVSGLEGWWLCSLRGRQGICPGNRLRIVPGFYDNGCGGLKMASDVQMTDKAISQSDLNDSLSKQVMTEKLSGPGDSFKRASSYCMNTNYDVPPCLVDFPNNLFRGSRGNIMKSGSSHATSLQDQFDQYDSPRTITEYSYESPQSSCLLNNKAPSHTLLNSTNFPQNLINTTTSKEGVDTTTYKNLLETSKEQLDIESSSEEGLQLKAVLSPPTEEDIYDVPRRGHSTIQSEISSTKNPEKQNVLVHSAAGSLCEEYAVPRPATASVYYCPTSREPPSPPLSLSRIDSDVPDSISLSRFEVSSNRSSLLYDTTNQDHYDVLPEPRSLQEQSNGYQTVQQDSSNPVHLESLYDIPNNTSHRSNLKGSSEEIDSGPSLRSKDQSICLGRQNLEEIYPDENTLTKLERTVVDNCSKLETSVLSGSLDDTEYTEVVQLLHKSLSELMCIVQHNIEDGTTVRDHQDIESESVQSLVKSINEDQVLIMDLLDCLQRPSSCSRSQEERIKLIVSRLPSLNENIHRIVFELSFTLQHVNLDCLNQSCGQSSDCLNQSCGHPVCLKPSCGQSSDCLNQSSGKCACLNQSCGQSTDFLNQSCGQSTDCLNQSCGKSESACLNQSSEKLNKESQLSHSSKETTVSDIVQMDSKDFPENEFSRGLNLDPPPIADNVATEDFNPAIPKKKENDSGVLKFYGSQAESEFRHLNIQIDDLLQGIENSHSPKAFVRLSKTILLSAHKLIFIGDATHRAVMNEPQAKARILDRTNALCDATKYAVVAVKNAALKFPSLCAVQSMVDAFVTILQVASDLTSIIC